MYLCGAGGQQMTPQFFIAIATILGLLIFLGAAYGSLGILAGKDQGAREAFLKLMNPASVVSLLILLGVLFLLGMAILDLDKGRVLVGMGKAPFARGLITYLFAIVTIGTAVVLVLSALLGTDKDKFDSAKEVLGLLLGIFGTIVGFYFASELAETDVRGALSASPVLTSAQEVAPDSEMTLTVAVQGGQPPYRFAVTFDGELPGEYPELVRPDGWIIKTLRVPASAQPGIRRVRVGIQDASAEKSSTETLVIVTAAKPPG
jgi:hypothetical protein